MSKKLLGEVLNMTPVQPGSYVALYKERQGNDTWTEPVFAIAQYVSWVEEGGYDVEMRPVIRTQDRFIVLAGWSEIEGISTYNTDDSAEDYVGIFAPDEINNA